MVPLARTGQALPSLEGGLVTLEPESSEGGHLSAAEEDTQDRQQGLPDFCPETAFLMVAVGSWSARKRGPPTKAAQGACLSPGWGLWQWPLGPQRPWSLVGLSPFIPHAWHTEHMSQIPLSETKFRGRMNGSRPTLVAL